MVNTSNYPGYGYMLKKGATTLWETWEEPDQASWNHPMFGSVSEWFYRSLLGINPDETTSGFDLIVLKPFTGADLKFAKGYYQSIRGKIGSSWKHEEETFLWNVEIPVNSRGRICVPASAIQKITEHGKPVTECADLKFTGSENGYILFDAVSGTYEFKVSS